MASELHLASPETLAEPHLVLAPVRERAPLVWSDAHRAWLVLGYEEAKSAFNDRRLSADRASGFERLANRSPEFRPAADLFRGWMIFRDPPAHDRLRDPVRRAFTPRSVSALEPAVTRIADSLLDAFEARGGGELRAEFARPLPALVIAELLGVPAEDRERFQGWSDALARLVFSVEAGRVDDAAARAAGQFMDYFRDLVAHYERRPADNLVSRMIAARDEDGLDAAELAGACTLLLFAGHETTTSLITNAVAVLFDHDEQREALLADPALDVTAPDEFLRFEGPAKTMVRRVAEPHERAGHALARGDRVFIVILAANRDPAVFARPHELDLARDPNPHLGFGWGLHRCLGASLARMETRVAVRRLLERFPNLAPTAAPTWGGDVLGRSVARLPLRV